MPSSLLRKYHDGYRQRDLGGGGGVQIERTSCEMPPRDGFSVAHFLPIAYRIRKASGSLTMTRVCRSFDDALWQRVREVQQARAHEVGERVQQGKARQAAASTGPGPRYLFSTLVSCAQCGANFVMVDGNFYGCSSHKHGGAAAWQNDYRVKRVLLEEGLLAGIRRSSSPPRLSRNSAGGS